MPELVAVFSSRQVLLMEKMTPHELLSDRRSALREITGLFIVLPSEPYKTCHQSSNPDFAQHARNYRIVNSAM